MPELGHSFVAKNHENMVIEQQEQYRTYTPLAQHIIKLWHYNKQTRDCKSKTQSPYFVAITGSVASGKTTTARFLKHAIQAQTQTPTVSVISTDNFLLNNKQLAAKKIENKKGFPQSYNTEELINTLHRLSLGDEKIATPEYCHKVYDILDNQKLWHVNNDIIILEGLNILNSNVMDYIDLCIYIDANEQALFTWFENRIHNYIQEARQDSNSFYYPFSLLTKEKVSSKLREVWQNINIKNLHENILPYKSKADMILEKDIYHRATKLWLKDNVKA